MIETEPQDQADLGGKNYETPLPGPAPKPRLRAATALLIFIIFLAGQVLIPFPIILFEFVKYILDGGDIEDQVAVAKLVSDMMPQIALTSVIGGALGLAGGSLIVKKSLHDNSPFGAAWIKAQPKTLLVSAVLGASAAVTYLLLVILVLPPSPEGTTGPLTKMAIQPGFECHSGLTRMALT